MSRNLPPQRDRNTGSHGGDDRESGFDPDEPPAVHHGHDHLALLYESASQRAAFVTSFLREGLERGEQCIYVVADPSGDRVLAELRDRGVDVDRALASGALSVQSMADVYLPDGSFDPNEVIEFFADGIEVAAAEYEGLRAAAEMSWFEDHGHPMEEVMAYEAAVNDFLAEAGCTGLCLYDRDDLAPSVVRDIVRTHPQLVDGEIVRENAHFALAPEFVGRERTARENDRMLGSLQERAETDSVSRRRRDRFAALFESIPEAAVHVRFEDGRPVVKAVNTAFEFTFGYSADRIVGAPLNEYVVPPDRREEAERIDDIACDGQDIAGEVVRTTADGERDFFFRGLTFEREDGTVEGFGIYDDVTPRTERLRELERYREYTDDVLDAVDDVFYVVGSDGHLQRWNESFSTITGYSDEKIAAMEGMNFFAKDEWERVVDAVDGVFETGSGRVNVDLLTADGDRIPHEFVASLVEDPDGDPVLAGIGRDVSEREERDRTLRDLYETTADADLSPRETVDRLLELGTDRFDLDMGLLNRIRGDELVVRHEVGTDGKLPVGTTTPLSESYCGKVLDSDRPVGIREARVEGWVDDPAYHQFGIEAYLGVELTVDGEPYALCFGSTDPRSEPFTAAEFTFVELMGQWLTQELERTRHEERLAALNEMSRVLMGAETRTELAEVAVQHAQSTLSLPVTALLCYDEETGTLSVDSETARSETELPVESLCERGGGPLWNAFVAEEVLVTDLDGAGDSLTEVVAIPLGREGLFVTASETRDGFSPTQVDFLETTAATVKAACTRVERERQLQEREAALEERNERLARVNRVNDIIRSIDRALVEASTREEIERVVCDRLAGAGPYELAWIGERDPVTEEITPRQWAGAEKTYLDQMWLSADPDVPEGQGPAGRSVRQRTVQVVDDVLQDETFRPWREEALNRGYHGCITLPLVYEDSMYGLLLVYAGQPGTFAGLERDVLTELSDTIAHAINAVESKKALVSDEVTELEFAVRDEDLGLQAFAGETGGELVLESVVPDPDGELRAYVTTRGASTAAVDAFASDLPFADLSLIAERDDGTCLYEARPTADNLVRAVIEHGGTPTEVTASGERVTVRVELASDAAIREFVEMLNRKFSNLELLAQRTYERSVTDGLRGSVTEALTSRQREALETAYFSGYFEKPRERTASEIAETMDISQPTFNHHLRAAHRKLCVGLFGDRRHDS